MSKKLKIKCYEKGKAIVFYANHMFISGHTASQCSKPLNTFSWISVILKKMIRRNIFLLMFWLDKCDHYIYTEMFIDIRNTINKPPNAENH